ncbi:MBOAT, membrane-bound O-acyltransferase family-domain-containing protein [Infundibulicybe gibba]|nr:MBOAT, membrane-bound O-acyltransferase family-domain-containing protein [Infundibulicybe gibba]
MGLVGLTVKIPSPPRNLDGKKLSRWGTLEFRFYIALACVVIPIMFWIPINLSSPSHPNYPYIRARLSEGWLFGRNIDNSDAQYRSFRNNLPVLTITAALYLLLKFAWSIFSSKTQQDRMHLIPFNLAFSILNLLALHGSSVLKIFAILIINFIIGKSFRGSKAGPLLTWVFNIAVLFLNDRYGGYHFSDVLPQLEFLDDYPGLYPRWYIIFNITMLRLISFNMDYYWACKRTEPLQAGNTINEKQRQAYPHPDDLYSFAYYLSYVLYTPLYIAGPIMTFNDYIWQHRRPTSVPRRAVLGYLCRFLICCLTMEFILHFMYVVAIKDRKAWLGDTPAEIGMIGFWNLMIVWLKLLIPWRFFRLWALMDGIDPPENMIRCMANNYSATGFWRSWHRSYNLWIIRYIYIPLGGGSNVFLNSLLVFSFVALWHDLTLRLLVWGWLVSLFIAPELLARYFLPQSRYGDKPWYRHACALGAVFNMMMMMSANLVGFVIGLDGLRFFLDQLFGTTQGLLFLVVAFFCMFVGVQLMFEYREEELRKGIYHRC